jgi:hypothetical protein
VLFRNNIEIVFDEFARIVAKSARRRATIAAVNIGDGGTNFRVRESANKMGRWKLERNDNNGNNNNINNNNNNKNTKNNIHRTSHVVDCDDLILSDRHSH